MFGLLFCCISILTAQEKRSFYLELKEGYELKNLVTQVKADNSLEVSMDNKTFETFINSKKVYEFKVAFKHAVMPRLKRTYYIETEVGISKEELLSREEVFRVEEIYELEEEHIDLDISLLPTGVYSIILVADGEVKTSKGLIKQ